MCLSQTLNFPVPPEHSLISNNKTSYALWSSGQFLDALSQAAGNQSMCTV